MSLEFELSWTGERLVPAHTGDTAIEHLHRYAFAREYVRGKQVLDIACGEGYGSHLLSSVAASVVGVDISPDVIAHARNRYGDKVNFTVGSCTSIPLSDASVDAVVSFETLEHVTEHEEMLREVKRVLRPGGVLILSTPDKLYYTILPKNQNPFHVRELSTEEFRSLLGQFFAHNYLFEQRICHGSVLAPAVGLPISGVRHYLGDFHRLAYTDGITAPIYNIAVATDDDSQLQHAVSLFQGWDIPTELEKRQSDAEAAHATAIGDAAAAHAAAIGDAAAAHAAAIGGLQKQMADAEAARAAAIDELEIRLADAEAARAELEKQLADATAAHAAAIGELEKQLADATAAHAAAIGELEKQLADAAVAHAAAFGELKKQLADANDAQAAAIGEIDVLRRHLNKIRHRAVDGAARLVNRFRFIPRFVRSAARATARLIRIPS